MTGLRRMLPSANALFVFESAARWHSFSGAAAELNVTQPAVSRMLARLEQHLGTRLFTRSAAGVDLTAEGRALYRVVARSFRDVENAIGELRPRPSGGEPLTLSLSSAFTTHWLMPRIDRFRAAFPTVDLRFQLIAGPLHGPVEVDLGMRFLTRDHPDYVPAFAVEETMLPVCSPAYRQAHDADHARHAIIDLSGWDGSWPESFAGLRADDSLRLAFPDYAVVLQAALLGQGVALGWSYVVSHWLRHGQLVPAAAGLIRTDRQCQLMLPKDRAARPIVLAVRDWLIAEIRAEMRIVHERYPGLGS
ncbi:LysR family transcriptional regulator [Marinivivus vitaminiproducens]|uniref:LysR family transcriptional regulator n=1 Tax=Marinivivus vitaminiproducens TaxID=3035935 RepID=UPI0027A61845|nr:LysR substrate-binding domain-containing protein [Geminicoccaceae bacterium SCSIO 64248]